MANLDGYQRGFNRGFQSGIEYAAIFGVSQDIKDSVSHLRALQQELHSKDAEAIISEAIISYEQTISSKDAEAITSYEQIVGFDPETGEAIWGEPVDG